MNNRFSHDELAQVLILFTCFVIFVSSFDLIVNITLFIFLSSILIASYLSYVLTKDKINFKSVHIPNFLLNIFLTLSLAFTVLTLVFSSVFYYLNYGSGFLYTLLMIIAIFGLVQGFINCKVFVEPTKISFIVLSILIGFYTATILFGAFFDLSIIFIPLSDPIHFLQGLMVTIPTRLVHHFQISYQQNGLIELVLGSLGPLVVLSIVITSIIFILFKYLEKNTDSGLSYTSHPPTISKFPFIMFLILISISQVANGLTAFLNNTFWLLIIIQATLGLRFWSNKNNYNGMRLQLTVLLWLIVIGFIQKPYTILMQITTLQSISTLKIIDSVYMMTFLFLLINSAIFFVVHKVITHCSFDEKANIIKEANFLGLILLLESIQNITLQLVLTGLLVLVFSFSIYQKSFLRNSINLYKVQMKKDLLQVLTQLSMFYLAFLLI